MHRLASLAVIVSMAVAGCGKHDQPTLPPPLSNMVLIPADTFTMGSPAGEPGRSLDETQHQVTLTKAIYVSACEVTQSEWQAVMGWNESEFPGASRPVEQVTWYDAVSYCNRRSTRELYTAAYTISGVTMEGNHITDATVAWNQAADGYRLLTEAEWEYACRAASSSAFCSGGLTADDCSQLDPNLDRVAWYCGNARETTHDVGGKSANAWGLKDMHGNVWEWCWDWYAEYPSGSVSDPVGLPAGSRRVLRGGSWYYIARCCRSAYRIADYPNNRLYGVGVRLARSTFAQVPAGVGGVPPSVSRSGPNQLDVRRT
jgi:formylglycine-generating enzyme required for sulfatase activity